MDKPLIRANPRDHAIFAAVTLLYWTSLYSYVPILSPYLLEDLQVGGTMAGVVLGSYGFMQLMVRLPLGIASDRMQRRKPFIAFGMLTAGLSCLLFVAGASPGWALAGRTVSGISASTWVAFTVLYAAYYPPRDVTKAMSTISFLIVAGELLGMGLSGWLAEDFGVQSVFYAGAAAGLAGLLLTLFIKEPKEGVSRTPIRLADIGAVVKSGTLIRVSILSILAHGILFITMFGFTPSYATGVLGASNAELSLLSIVFMVPHALAQFFSGRLIVPKLGIWTTIGISFAFSGLFTTAIPFTESMTALYVTQALNGLAQGLHFPLFLSLAISGTAAEKQATAMGFYQAVYSIGMFAGPFIAGIINDWGGLNAGFWLGGMTGFASVAVTLWFAAIARRKQQLQGN